MTRELQFLRTMRIAGIGIGLILFVAFFFAYRSLTKSRELAGWVQHTHEVIGLIANVRLERARLQNEMWTYLATQDANIPKTFQEELSASRQDLDRLRSLTADNTTQQEIVSALLPGLNARAEALVQAMKEPAPEKAIPGAAVDLAFGVYSPAKTRELFEALDANARTLLATRTAAVAANARQTRIILLIAGVLTFAVLGMAGVFIRREVLMRTEIERGLQAARELLGTKYEEQSGELRQTMSDLHSEIRARQSAEDEIRQANDELENRVTQRTAELRQINQELEAFTYSVSHDLRAPLRHLNGFSRILEAEYSGRLPAEARHYLDRIANAATHMTTLVEDLLSLSKIGRQELQKKRVSLRELVGEARSELAEDGGATAIEWRVEELPEVEGDPALLKLVLTNLLSNAVKFTSHEPRAVIEIGSRDEGEETVVFVRDNGAGFEPRYADKLFGVFQRLHRQDEFPGTGIGLATVQRIVHRHNGRVWADSQVGRGASFYFSLPSVKTKVEEIGVAMGATA
jgi:signal transduction histidine kinase